MPVIQTLIGKVVMRKKSATVAIYHSPRVGGASRKEQWLGKAAENFTTGRVVHKVGGQRFYSAIPGILQSEGGRFTRQAYDVNEGEILKVAVQRRRGYGKRPVNGTVYLRVRATGAHRIVRFAMVEHVDVTHQAAEIEGPFDVITAAEAKALGAPVNPMYKVVHSEKAARAVLTENIVVQAETVQAVKLEEKEVVTGDGEKKVITVAKRKRRGLKF